jgi:hypothetical protein
MHLLTLVSHIWLICVAAVPDSLFCELAGLAG